MALPSDISGLVRWWRGSDLTGGNGAAISSWAAASGGGSVALAQATGGLQPTVASSVAGLNNQPAALFDGVDDQLAGTITSLTHPVTFFIVYLQVSPGTGFYGLFNTSNEDALLAYGTYLHKRMAGGSAFDSTVPEPAAAGIFIARWNGASSVIGEGGSTLTDSTGDPGASTTTGTGVAIGDSVGGGIPFGGYIAECGIYNVDIGATDEAALFAGLAVKYGLAMASNVIVADSSGYLRARAA